MGRVLARHRFEAAPRGTVADGLSMVEQRNIARSVRIYSRSPSPPPGGGEGRGEVGHAPSQPTSPSHRAAMGPSLSPLKGGEGKSPPFRGELSLINISEP